MNDMNREQMDERLWDFIDGLSSLPERSAIEGLIATHGEWRTKYEELLEVHQAMAAAELEVPSLRFTKNVMDEIARHQVAPATNSYLNKNVIRGIAAFFLVTIAGLLVYCLGQYNWSGNGSSNLATRYGTELQNNLNKFNWGNIFNNTSLNIFLMVNLILGLMLLDMYLRRRKTEAGKQAI
jgi:hypothetical protein